MKIKDFFNYINKIEEVSFVEKQQEYLFILKWDNRINIELRILGKEYFELECFKTSCSMEHLEILAKEYGYKDERFLECKDERILYKSLGLDFIPPELREGKFEFIYNKRISEIVTFSDLKGIFHIHTRYSDGSNTIEEYVLKCLEYNFEYMGISDHSSSLTSDKLKQQHEEIDFLNNKYKPFKIFKGIEVDVDQNGDYEYDSQLTDNFDFIIASFHQSPLRNNFSNEFITNLYLKVITNKSTKIIGHPLRRCLPFEPGFEIDIDVFKESCLHTNVAIEFNTERKRFDIDWRLINDNISLESPLISINPDAHNIEDIETLKNGVINIRKGFLLKNRTLNTLNSSEILNYFNK